MTSMEPQKATVDDLPPIPACGDVHCTCSAVSIITWYQRNGYIPGSYKSKTNLSEAQLLDIFHKDTNISVADLHTERDVRTQKGISVVSLSEKSGSGGRYLRTSLASDATVAPQEPKKEFPFFARPCPATPRHGFVDSRVVEDREDWIGLLQELMACDDDEWEILCMDFMDADWNGIITPAGVTIGPDHDGATEGNNAVSVPAPAMDDDFFDSVFGIDRRFANVQDTPYIEIVGTGENTVYDKETNVQAVQVRDGPEVTFADAAIPTETRVEEVIEAGGDLQEWESIIQAVANDDGREGVVVHHPDGSLASHYAVHCVVNDVPVVCWDDAPDIGDTLEPTTDDDNTLGGGEYVQLADYIYQYNQRYLDVSNCALYDHSKNAVKVALTSLHANNYWGGDDHLLRLQAIGVVAVLRASAAAIIGEDRHWTQSGPGRFAKDSAVWSLVDERNIGMPSSGRDSIYEVGFLKPLGDIASLLPAAVEDFECYGWTRAYGGSPWAECSIEVIDFYRAVGTFLKHPEEDTWNHVLAALNDVIHVSHNNSYLLTKFATSQTFDDSANAPVVGILTDFAVQEAMINPPMFDDGEANPTLLGEAIIEGLEIGQSADISQRWDNQEAHAQYQFVEDVGSSDYYHFQVACDEVNRDYGWAFNVEVRNISSEARRILRRNSRYTRSLVEDSESKYRAVRAVIDGDVVTLYHKGDTVNIDIDNIDPV